MSGGGWLRSVLAPLIDATPSNPLVAHRLRYRSPFSWWNLALLIGVGVVWWGRCNVSWDVWRTVRLAPPALRPAYWEAMLGSRPSGESLAVSLRFAGWGFGLLVGLGALCLCGSFARGTRRQRAISEELLTTALTPREILLAQEDWPLLKTFGAILLACVSFALPGFVPGSRGGIDEFGWSPGFALPVPAAVGAWCGVFLLHRVLLAFRSAGARAFRHLWPAIAGCCLGIGLFSAANPSSPLGAIIGFPFLDMDELGLRVAIALAVPTSAWALLRLRSGPEYWRLRGIAVALVLLDAVRSAWADPEARAASLRATAAVPAFAGLILGIAGATDGIFVRELGGIPERRRGGPFAWRRWFALGAVAFSWARFRRFAIRAVPAIALCVFAARGVGPVALGWTGTFFASATTSPAPPAPAPPPRGAPSHAIVALDPASLGFSIGSATIEPERALDSDARFVPFVGVLDPPGKFGVHVDCILILWDRPEARVCAILGFREDTEPWIAFAEEAGVFVVAAKHPSGSGSEIAVVGSDGGIRSSFVAKVSKEQLVEASPDGKRLVAIPGLIRAAWPALSRPIIVDLIDGSEKEEPIPADWCRFSDSHTLLCLTPGSNFGADWTATHPRALFEWKIDADRAATYPKFVEDRSRGEFLDLGRGDILLDSRSTFFQAYAFFLADYYVEVSRWPGTASIRRHPLRYGYGGWIPPDVLDANRLDLAGAPAGLGSSGQSMRYELAFAAFRSDKRDGGRWPSRPAPDLFVLVDLSNGERYKINIDGGPKYRWVRFVANEWLAAGLADGGVQFIRVDEVATPDRRLARGAEETDSDSPVARD